MHCASFYDILKKIKVQICPIFIYKQHQLIGPSADIPVIFPDFKLANMNIVCLVFIHRNPMFVLHAL